MAWRAVEHEKPPSKTELMGVFEYAGDKSREFVAVIRIGGEWYENHKIKKLNPKQGRITHWDYPPEFPARADRPLGLGTEVP